MPVFSSGKVVAACKNGFYYEENASLFLPCAFWRAFSVCCHDGRDELFDDHFFQFGGDCYRFDGYYGAEAWFVWLEYAGRRNAANVVLSEGYTLFI